MEPTVTPACCLLIPWRRLLSGRFDDPLLGRDVVLGCAAGALLAIVWRFATLSPTLVGLPASTPDPFPHVDKLAGAGRVGFGTVVNRYGGTLYALAFLLTLFGFKTALAGRPLFGRPLLED